MFENITHRLMPTPYSSVDSKIQSVDYYMTPLPSKCAHQRQKVNYLGEDIVQLATKVKYENGETWGNILPISFLALKKLVMDAENEEEHTGSCIIEYDPTAVTTE